eukprot:g2747.t1
MTEQVKRALLVGCVYPGKPYELYGCINDMKNIRQLLTECFGFQTENITVLTDDKAHTGDLPTSQNIKENLERVVRDSGPGDVLFFYFAGHGAQITDQDCDEADGLDEVIVPSDEKLLRDDELRQILCKLKPDVKCTMLCDSCSSGTILDGVAVSLSEEHVANSEDEKVCGVIEASKNLSNVVAITGCKSDQLSGEIYLDGKVRGLFTASVSKIIHQAYYDSKTTLTNKRLAKMVSDEVLSTRPDQQICLECTLELADKNFIDW